jgi:hypothetical protein
MKKIICIAKFLIILPFCYSQTPFKSTVYGYSFIVAEGWTIKDKIYTPGVDAKIVDGKGNSFVVSVNPLPAELKGVSTKQMFKDANEQEIINNFCAVYDDCRLLKRGTYFIDGKEFYYIHLSDPFKDGLRVIHKMFMYNYKENAYSIDCSAISSMTVDTSPFFDLMLRSFKFN